MRSNVTILKPNFKYNVCWVYNIRKKLQFPPNFSNINNQHSKWQSEFNIFNCQGQIIQVSIRLVSFWPGINKNEKKEYVEDPGPVK